MYAVSLIIIIIIFLFVWNIKEILLWKTFNHPKDSTAFSIYNIHIYKFCYNGHTYLNVIHLCVGLHIIMRLPMARTRQQQQQQLLNLWKEHYFRSSLSYSQDHKTMWRGIKPIIWKANNLYLMTCELIEIYMKWSSTTQKYSVSVSIKMFYMSILYIFIWKVRGKSETIY